MTITMEQVRELVGKGISSWSKKDNSVRGIDTVSTSELRVGDEIVVNDEFTEIVEG